MHLPGISTVRLAIVLSATALLLSACGGGPSGPDLVLYNATVITMDSDGSTAGAIAIDDGKVAAVGSDEDILDLQGSGTETIDLGGRALMPGFVDPHTHILNDAGSQGMTLREAQDLAFENGITALGNLYTDSNFLRQLTATDEQGELRVRTSLYLSRTTNCGEDLGDWYKAYPPEGDPEKMLRVVGVKLFADGGSCGLPAYSPDLGNLWFTQQQMDQFVAEADSLGYQLAVHAIGDRGLEQAQNAIAAALAGRPNELRHRIEHNSAIRPDLLPRYAELGIVPVISSNSGACALFYTGEPFVGPDRTSWLRPYRALLATGVQHVAWHSDYPFTSTDPFRHMFNLVTGKQIAGGGGIDDVVDAEGFAPGDVCEPPEWAKEQTVTVQEALRMMTIDAAYALGQESVIGSLEPGKLADLVVVSDSPLTVDPDAIKDIQVLMTMVGGSTAFCMPAQPDICPD
ncbi:MAG: amidohydrolase family protein [Dehalococcoidia bacterium]